jgi:C_GCAxxG_C_C family probable redox protein
MDRKNLAQARHQQGFNCSQCVLAAFADELGLNQASALKIAAGFGGGLGRTGETCGIVTGAVMVLGLKYGPVAATDLASKEAAYAKVREFLRLFQERHQALRCRDLLRCDISTPEGFQSARARNLFATQCAAYIGDAVDILEQLLEPEQAGPPRKNPTAA